MLQERGGTLHCIGYAPTRQYILAAATISGEIIAAVVRSKSTNPATFKTGAVPSTFIIFTALRGMQSRSSNENSVRLSVCPSVKRVNCDKTEERSVEILYHTKYHLT